MALWKKGLPKTFPRELLFIQGCVCTLRKEVIWFLPIGSLQPHSLEHPQQSMAFSYPSQSYWQCSSDVQHVSTEKPQQVPSCLEGSELVPYFNASSQNRSISFSCVGQVGEVYDNQQLHSLILLSSGHSLALLVLGIFLLVYSKLQPISFLFLHPIIRSSKWNKAVDYFSPPSDKFFALVAGQVEWQVFSLDENS